VFVGYRFLLFITLDADGMLQCESPDVLPDCVGTHAFNVLPYLSIYIPEYVRNGIKATRCKRDSG
jgi:hypothetical protein